MGAAQYPKRAAAGGEGASRAGKRGAGGLYRAADRLYGGAYGAVGAGGLSALRRLLPVVSYIARRARERGSGERAVAEVVEEMLRDVRGAQREVAAFVSGLSSRVDDGAAKSFLQSAAEAVRDLGLADLERVLRTIAEDEGIQKALVRYDVLGALFERAVYEAFRGRAGQYLTHRNIVIAMREMVWAQFEAEGLSPASVKVYDPCAGSARFLTLWLEKVLKAFPEYREPRRLVDYAERHLFATDRSSEMVGIAAVNMAIHGGGVGNVFRADAANHFGPIVNLRASREFLTSFLEKWDRVRRGVGAARGLESVEEAVYRFAEAVLKGLERGVVEVDVSSEEFLSFVDAVRSLGRDDVALRALSGLEELAKLAELPPVAYLMKRKWGSRNSEVRRGFDLVLTNPPIGRRGRLLVEDRYILAQYALAQSEWVYGMSGRRRRELAKMLGVGDRPEEIAERLGREWVVPEDYGGCACRLVLRDPELGWSYTVYYGSDLEPVLLHSRLPIQVVLLEQFLRVVRLGGKVFTVIDVGVLSNPGDEWVRRLLLTAKHVPVRARLRAVVELPHGAFRYAGAGVRAALLLYERVEDAPEDYEFFVALAEYVGYDTHSRDAEPIEKNDLPVIVAEYMRWVGRKPEYYEECWSEWRERRACGWWERELGAA